MNTRIINIFKPKPENINFMKTFVRLTHFLKSFYLGILIVISVFSFSSCEEENNACCIIHSPNDGQKFTLGQQVTIELETRDEESVGLSNVKIYIDNSIKYTGTRDMYGGANEKSVNHFYWWQTENASIGEHEIKVVAKTPGGMEMTESIFINLDADYATVVFDRTEFLSIDSIKCFYSIPFDGGLEITEHGICWAINSTPDINQNAMPFSGEGNDYNVLFNVTGENTNVNIKAYAKSEKGISYSDLVSVKTWEVDSFTDARDGKTYKTVKIGNQWWMAENLAFLPKVDKPTKYSDTIPYYYVNGYWDTNLPMAKYTSEYQNYGVLYNWEAAKTAAPDGWRLPSKEDFEELFLFVENKKGVDMDEACHGISMYLRNSKGWKANDGGFCYTVDEYGNTFPGDTNSNGTNEFGFTLKPAGYRQACEHFEGIGLRSWLWASSSSTNSDELCYYVDSYGDTRVNIYCDDDLKSLGFSIRCIKE